MNWNNDKQRVQILTESGFKVMTVWQDEYLKNKEKILNKVIKEVNDYEN